MAYTTIDNPELYFQTVLYTGNGSDNHAITFDNTDTSMSPNIVWMRSRTQSGYNHYIVDTLRGVTKALRPNLYNDEDTYSDAFKSFDSNGFTLDDDASNSEINQNTKTYVAWAWATGTNGSGTTTGSGTGQAYTYSVNTTAGISIMAYTGNGTANHTIPHHLGSTPEWFIVKIRTGDNNNWGVYHHKSNANPEEYALYLDGTSAATDDAFLNDTAPTSTAINLSSGNYGNVNGNTYISYCFSEVKGFSKFGKYEGNGNSDGPFVYTGFRPAWVMTKSIDTTSNWNIFDNKRSTFNDVDDYIKANANAPEDTDSSNIQMDFLSNGFKLRGDNDEANGSETFIYMAFAESPFVNSNGIPTNAR